MADVTLTTEQLEATVNNGGALLVSAAAGSGKTKVLVDRLLKKVLEPGSDCDVDDFLIITYTNAAAAELRGKILDAIYEGLALDPENRKLRREIDICSRAQIETIHSFCAGVIRENAHILGISPDFRIADDTEAQSLKEETLSELIEEAYNSGDDAFFRLADTMGAGRDDSALVSIILDTHTKLLSHPYPDDWVEQQIAMLTDDHVQDAGETAWGKVILSKAARWADYACARVENMLDETACDPALEKAYGPSLSATFASLQAFRAALNEGWDRAKAAADIDFPRAGSLSGYDELKKERNAIKDESKKLADLFCDDSAKALSDMRYVAPVVSSLLRLVLRFDEAYAAVKRKRGVIDFSDQEHLALRLLVNRRTGAPTETAHRISLRFREIMVDEYQDVNAIQELIFRAVSKDGRNVFMVGDVKQSIYRFRLADPTIFLQKYATFLDYPDAKEGEGRKIILSRNFRSRAGVLDAVNYVFRNVMSREFGEMDYTEKEALYPGAPYTETEEPTVELDVLNMVSLDEDADKTETEAAFAARRISELIGTMTVSDGEGGTRPLRYGDIAILMRSPRSRAAVWTAALTKAGIPVFFDTESDFFESSEVVIALSLLAVIDNPHEDIPLVSVLRSPLYEVSSEELAEIRAEDKKADFFTALKKAAEKNEKLKRFLTDLEDFRRTAPDMPADEFLWYAFSKTELFAIAGAMPSGEKRRDNLMLLIECARKFESAGYKGLFGFVSYMRKLMEQGTPPVGNEVGSGDNAVTIMSIHKSKGLEFPVVFLADNNHRFNTDDSKKPLLVHPDLGVGPKKIDLERRIAYPTLARRAVKIRITEENLAEELRVLYVAMTRAREKLIMLTTYRDAEKELTGVTGVPLPVPPAMMESGKCFADWLMMAALRRAECEPLRFGRPNIPADYEGEAWDVRLIDSFTPAENAVTAEERSKRETFTDEELSRIIERAEWVYPHKSAVLMPSKVTATELKGTFTDEETHEDATELTVQAPRLTPPHRPAFARGKKKLTAAEKGTATHLVMQYADYEKCLTVEGARDEIERLHAMKSLSDEEAEAVRPEVIAAFFSSHAGKLVLDADRLWRELKFSVLVPSEKVPGYEAGEEMLLQGVVDCCVLKNDALTIIDFKTDYVTEATCRERAEYYRGQLDAYALAMNKIMDKPVAARVLYFLTAGIEVEL